MTRRHRLAAIAFSATVALSSTGCSSDGTADAPPAGSTTTSMPAAASDLTSPPTSAATATTAAAAPATTMPAGTGAGDTTEAATCAARLDVRALAGLVVWPAADVRRWEDVVTAVTDQGVGGVLLMTPDGWTSEEVAARLAELDAASRRGLVVATDEEGGIVQRLRVLGDLPSQRELGRIADAEPDEAAGLDLVRTIVADHGRAVRAAGVDVVFGPVVDVEPVDGDVPLAPSRFFPGDADRVTELAGAVIDGWADAGIVATLKHFPGHGAASGDTHDVDGVTPPIDQLLERDLLPYVALGDRVAAGDAIVMVGHLTVPGLTDGVPATRSRAAIDLLRDLDGHADVLVVSDALGMSAVGLPEPEASVAALAAGIDVVVFTRTSQTGPVIDAIVEAVADGRLDDSSLRTSAARVIDLLARDGHPCDAPAS